MGHVAHFVPLAEAHGATEIVLDDAEVVAVVGDVGGELGAVAPADDTLLAQLRRLPVHFQLELVGFHQPGGSVSPSPSCSGACRPRSGSSDAALALARRAIERRDRMVSDTALRDYSPGARLVFFLGSRGGAH